MTYGGMTVQTTKNRAAMNSGITDRILDLSKLLNKEPKANNAAMM